MAVKMFLAAVLMLTVLSIQQTSVKADCWWTGCQPSDWAVVGCDHYGREERGTQACNDNRGVAGFKYNCCTREGGGGGHGGDGGEDGEEFDDFVPVAIPEDASELGEQDGQQIPVLVVDGNRNPKNAEWGRQDAKAMRWMLTTRNIQPL